MRALVYTSFFNEVLSHQEKVKSQLATSGRDPHLLRPWTALRWALHGMGLRVRGAGTVACPCSGRRSRWAHRWRGVTKQVGYLSFGKQRQSFETLALWWLRCFLRDVFHSFFFPFLNKLLWNSGASLISTAFTCIYHSVDSSAKTGVIRPKIYHQEAYFNYLE